MRADIRPPRRPGAKTSRKADHRKDKPAKKRSSWFVRLVVAVISLGFLGLGTAIGGVIWLFWEYGRDLPEYYQLAEYEPPVMTRVHAGNGALLAEYATQRRVFVPITGMPRPLIEAFLSAEDKDFYHHPGVDLKALVRAMATNVVNIGTGRRPIGASTITQQVAKNFLLTNEVSVERKIREAILAIRMERAFTKDQLLALYLNEIYLGFGSYGVAAAALNYFDKSLDTLSLAEMAYLAALPKAPNNYHPRRKYKAAIARRNWVLKQMARNGYITLEEARRASAEPITIRPRSGVDGADAPYFAEEVRRQMVDHFGDDTFYTGGLSIRTTLDPVLQEIADKAIIEGLEALDKRQGWRGPVGRYSPDQDMEDALTTAGEVMQKGRYAALVVSVTPRKAKIILRNTETGTPVLERGEIPFELADWAYPPRDENGIRPPKVTSFAEVVNVNDIIMVQRPRDVPDRMAKLEKEITIDDDTWALGQRPLVQGALVALDPHTGRVRAMVGGYNARESEFNRVTQAQRQPGSAIKPFVYLAALDHGFSPTTRILDAPLVVDQGPGQKKWKPANYTRKFYGPSIMRLGIEQSRNLMTARLAMAIGMPKVQDYARKFGIDEDMPPLLSMSLGAGETTLMKLTAAYGMVVNGGSYIEPSIIDRVQDRYGKTVIRHDARPCRNCAVEDISAAVLPPAIEDNRPKVTDPASAYQMVTMLEGVITRGTGRRIGATGFAVAGKTGTTNDNTNAWFVGFTPDLAVGVYVGYDQPRPLGKRETGSTAAVPIFAQFIRDAMAGEAAIPFRRPDGVNLFTINALNGERARAGDDDVIIEAFKPGQRPLTQGENASVIDVPGADDRPVAEPLQGLY
ncbi:MAG: penicillin-binding protein 1A [Alphaproteobacteria bacterium]|nr:penicillin-binding protein 1A [Alphaproteobacteria bacterium]